MKFPSASLLVYKNHAKSLSTIKCHKYSKVWSHSWKGFVCLTCEPWSLYVFVTVCQSTLKFAQEFFCIQIIYVIKLTEKKLVKAQNILTSPLKTQP